MASTFTHKYEWVQILAISRNMERARTRPDNRNAMEYAACILESGTVFSGVLNKYVEGFGNVAVVLFTLPGELIKRSLDVWIERPVNAPPYVYGEW